MKKKVSSESVVKDIRRRTRTKYSSEQKIRSFPGIDRNAINLLDIGIPALPAG
jgi:hypothetical protein